jgi:hypothetical protein
MRAAVPRRYCPAITKTVAPIATNSSPHQKSLWDRIRNKTPLALKAQRPARRRGGSQ